MQWVVETTLLDSNFTKPCYIVCEVKAAQMLCLNGGIRSIKSVAEEKYVGDIIIGNSLTESVKATVQNGR